MIKNKKKNIKGYFFLLKIQKESLLSLKEFIRKWNLKFSLQIKMPAYEARKRIPLEKKIHNEHNTKCSETYKSNFSKGQFKEYQI